MANALGLDLAAVHQARDTRALNAQNQQINALNIQAAQAKAAQAPKINSLAQQFSTGSLQDKKDAALQMGQYDPARSKQMFEMYSKMSEEQKAQTKELTANVAKYGVGMLQETDPQKWVQSYTQNLTAIAQRYGADAVKDAPGLNEPIEKQRAWVQEQVNDALGFQEVYKAAQPQKPNIIEGADGYKYDANTGKRILPGVQKTPDKIQTTKDAEGYVRNVLTGERIFPDVEQTPKKGENFETEQKLRKEFNAQSKDFIKVRDAYGRIQASASDPSAAGDLALIFNYMKVLDPGSTVREGEFATAQNSAGVPAQIRAKLNSVINGERLDSTTREDFVNRAGRLYQQQESFYTATSERYKVLAENYGLDPNNVAQDFKQGFVQEDGTPKTVLKFDAEGNPIE